MSGGRKILCQRCGKRMEVHYSRDTRQCVDCKAVPWPPVSNWMSLAACNSEVHNPDWWWPESNSAETTNLAVQICRYCPVREMCRDYAIQHMLDEGIWGGLMPAERRALRAVKRRAV